MSLIQMFPYSEEAGIVCKYFLCVIKLKTAREKDPSGMARTCQMEIKGVGNRTWTGWRRGKRSVDGFYGRSGGVLCPRQGERRG
jgi:hypothetical protein